MRIDSEQQAREGICTLSLAFKLEKSNRNDWFDRIQRRVLTFYDVSGLDRSILGAFAWRWDVCVPSRGKRPTPPLYEGALTGLQRLIPFSNVKHAHGIDRDPPPDDTPPFPDNNTPHRGKESRSAGRSGQPVKASKQHGGGRRGPALPAGGHHGGGLRRGGLHEGTYCM